MNKSKRRNMMKEDPSVKFTCCLCDKQLASRSSLFNHNQLVHKIQPTQRTSIACKELGCAFTCNLKQKLRDHLSIIHGKSMQCKKETFSSMQVFEEWLSTLKQQHKSQYIKKHNTRTDCFNRKYQYLTCSRSGRSNTNADGTKQSQVTSKINGHCTSFITYFLSADGSVDVKYCLTHHGHPTEPSSDGLQSSRLAFRDALECLQREVEKQEDQDVIDEAARQLQQIERTLALRRTNKQQAEVNWLPDLLQYETIAVFTDPQINRDINETANRFILPKEEFLTIKKES